MSGVHPAGRPTKRFSQVVTYKGRTLTIREWSKETGRPPGQILAKFDRGVPLDDLLSPSFRSRP